MSEVTVVVPSWNGRQQLGRLLERLRLQTVPIAAIIVVDNASQDGSAELARGAGARVIELDRNRGFAAAVNRGIRESRTEWIAILNNDVEPRPDWLERLGQSLQLPGVWFATGKLVSAARPEVLDGTWDMVCRGGCAWRAGHGRADGPAWSQGRSIRSAPLTAALFRAELFRRVGLLDETFFSYLEDVDFGLRCAELNYLGRYVPEAVATHVGSGTLGAWHKEVVRRVARNQVLLVAKHYPARHLLRYAWPILAAQTLWGLVALRHGRGLAYLRGKLEGLAGYRAARRRMRRGGGIPRGVSKILEEGDAEIRQLQRETGFDPYWRVYFALTSWS